MRNVAGSAASDTGAFVGGGCYNSAIGRYAAVGGGRYNYAYGTKTTIAGGDSNRIEGYGYGTISGGRYNRIVETYGSVGGGYSNLVSGSVGTIGGGDANVVAGAAAVVGGGRFNTNYGYRGVIGGGYSNDVRDYYGSVGGGYMNDAWGYASAITGGYLNQIGRDTFGTDGDYAFAAGYRAKAKANGSFVWGDATNSDVVSDTDNMWVARCAGGVKFFSNGAMTTGVRLAPGGGSWGSISDSLTKENFRSLDKQVLLDRLAGLRVREWNFKSQDPAIRHIGPVAQDLYNAFGYGETERMINTEDADGVLFAAVQALYEQNRELRADTRAMQAEIEALRAELKRR